jgi:hypothetical protein
VQPVFIGASQIRDSWRLTKAEASTTKTQCSRLPYLVAPGAVITDADWSSGDSETAQTSGEPCFGNFVRLIFQGRAFVVARSADKFTWRSVVCLQTGRLKVGLPGIGNSGLQSLLDAAKKVSRKWSMSMCVIGIFHFGTPLGRPMGRVKIQNHSVKCGLGRRDGSRTPKGVLPGSSPFCDLVWRFPPSLPSFAWCKRI